MWQDLSSLILFWTVAGKGRIDYSLSIDLSVVIFAVCFLYSWLLKIPAAAPTDADAYNQDNFGFT